MCACDKNKKNNNDKSRKNQTNKKAKNTNWKHKEKMALANFTLPFGSGIVASNWATVSPIQHHHATAVNNLLYSPETHQKSNDLPDDPHHPYYKNDPYAPPAPTPNRQYRSRGYLPPSPVLQPTALPPQQFDTPRPFPLRTQTPPQYQNDINVPQQPQPLPHSQQLQQLPPQNIQSPDAAALYDYNAQRINYDAMVTATPLPQIDGQENEQGSVADGAADDTAYPEQQRPVYTQVKAGVGSKTQVHAVLDYDNDEDDEYYDDDDGNTSGKPGRSKPKVLISVFHSFDSITPFTVRLFMHCMTTKSECIYKSDVHIVVSPIYSRLHKGNVVATLLLCLGV